MKDPTLTVPGELAKMSIEAKRQVGYDLEPLVGREVKGGSHDALNNAIMDALDELYAQKSPDLMGVLIGHGLNELAGIASGDTPGAAVADAPAPMAEGGGAPAKASEPVLCIQLKAHPGSGLVNLYHHDVVMDPLPEHARLIRQRAAHVVLSVREALEVVGTGQGRLNRDYSRFEHVRL